MLILEMKNDLHTKSAVFLLGRKIKEIRKMKRLTQETLANRIAASVNMISSVERGIRAPSIELLERLSSAFDVPIKEFFDFFPSNEINDSPAKEDIIILVNMLKEQPPRKVRFISELTKQIIPKMK